jgi:hypothetical protein
MPLGPGLPQASQLPAQQVASGSRVQSSFSQQTTSFGPVQQNTLIGSSGSPDWKQSVSGQHLPPQLQNPPLQQNSGLAPSGTGSLAQAAGSQIPSLS